MITINLVNNITYYYHYYISITFMHRFTMIIHQMALINVITVNAKKIPMHVTTMITISIKRNNMNTHVLTRFISTVFYYACYACLYNCKLYCHGADDYDEHDYHE